jgi:transcriptional regulatory protein LevR
VEETAKLDIEKRLALLEETSVIDASLRSATEEAVATIAGRLGRSLESDTGHMLVTHVAMALKRAKAGESLREPTEEMRAELASRESELALARELMERLEAEADVDLPDGEVYLIAAYVAALKEEGS